jgi:hypothetical protein
MVGDLEFKKVKEAVKANTLCPGVGYKIKRTIAGTTLEINQKASSPEIPKPFQLISTVDPADVTPPYTLMIRVVKSTIAGMLPTGFETDDDPPYLLTPVGTSGVVFAGVTINATTQNIDSVFVDCDATLPSDTGTTFHQTIGAYEIADGILTVSNIGYGPIWVFRKWFVYPATVGFLLQ